MGDRYFINIECPFCGNEEEDWYYAPTCGFDYYRCLKCNMTSFIVGIKARKPEDITAHELTDEFLSGLNMWNPDESEKKRILKNNKNRIKIAIKENKLIGEEE